MLKSVGVELVERGGRGAEGEGPALRPAAGSERVLSQTPSIQAQRPETTRQESQYSAIIDTVRNEYSGKPSKIELRDGDQADRGIRRKPPPPADRTNDG